MIKTAKKKALEKLERTEREDCARRACSACRLRYVYTCCKHEIDLERLETVAKLRGLANMG